MIHQRYFEQLATDATRENEIRNRHYHLYRVKRGLRNADGSGVLVGLTTVSSVLGYEKIDEEIIPVEGRLYYRGIDLQDLVRGFSDSNRFGFEETVFLLLFGWLPTTEQLQDFSALMGEMRQLRLNFARDVLQTFRTRDVMNALARSVMTLYGIDEDAENLKVSNQIRQAMELAAKIVTLVPYAYYSIQHGFYNGSLIIHPPDPMLSSAENFLRLLRPNQQYTEIEAKTLDVAMVLHADHGGGNNSTFTMRVVSSTLTDIYSAAAAALGSLKGPLHGGASGRVATMMKDIKENVKNWNSGDEVRAYLRKILAGEAFDGQQKLYGIGHAVYTLSDPRAVILKRYARELAKEKGREEEFALYEAVEQEAPDAVREIKNNPDMALSANVDFYSGFVYDCLDIPVELYTPIFAMSRMAGWCAHRLELVTNPNKLMRPAYKSITKMKPYIPLQEREEKKDIPV